MSPSLTFNMYVVKILLYLRPPSLIIQSVDGKDLSVSLEDINKIISCPRPDTVKEMEVHLQDNISDPSVSAGTPVVKPISPNPDVNISHLRNNVVGSKDKLCFISFRGAHTLRPRWYLVQIRLDTEDIDKEWFVDFFRRRRKTIRPVIGLTGTRLYGKTKRSRAGIMVVMF